LELLGCGSQKRLHLGVGHDLGLAARWPFLKGSPHPDRARTERGELLFPGNLCASPEGESGSVLGVGVGKRVSSENNPMNEMASEGRAS
jgi:hypothetical protein